MQPCRIIKTNEYTNKSIVWGTCKSKKEAILLLKYHKKHIAPILYSESVFSAKKLTLTCHHAENDNVTYYRIELLPKLENIIYKN
jgi:hypothetical protein